MPDWSYRTVFRPLLFRLPSAFARELTLGVMGTLARLPGGGAVIDFLGHMRPDERLGQSLLGLEFPGPVGLAGDVDINATALRALARLGVGFVEVGPITSQPILGNVERRVEQQALWYPDPPPNPGAAAMRQRLERWGKLPVPLLVRVGDAATAAELAPLADAVVVKTLDQQRLSEVLQAALGKPLLLAVNADVDRTQLPGLIACGISGVVVDAILSDQSGCVAGRPAFEAVLEIVRHLKGQGFPIIAGGVHEPRDALLLRDAGANLVTVSTGLIYSGPGLPKRVNEAWLASIPQSPPATPKRAPEMTWFWTLLMGLGMLGGGLLALAIAATRVVLPYDEIFSGMTREQLDHINPRLLPFMAHDRVSLAGTMITIGVLYSLLSWFGIRRGQHWAKLAVLASAFSGFASFFLFLGFGYFDPFHAFVTAILFQFLLMALACKIAKPQAVGSDLREDWRWRWCQWGQLLLIVHNTVLIGAGSFIAFTGSTHVFVHEDLDFMQTTAEALIAANPRLVPLVAHDRASFGGMIIASGITLLLTSLWGFRRGERWLWWTLVLAAAPAYLTGIGVHFVVGYTHLTHLAPACAGAVVFTIAMVLARPYLGATANPDG